jgi:hypothetical protein
MTAIEEYRSNLITARFQPRSIRADRQHSPYHHLRKSIQLFYRLPYRSLATIE